MSLRGWLRDKIIEFVLGDDERAHLPAEPVAVDVVEPAPDDAPLLGPEAASMLAGDRSSFDADPPAPPLEGSVEERRARLRLR